MSELCFDRNPNNLGMTCSRPLGHVGRHWMDVSLTWPSLRAYAAGLPSTPEDAA